MIQATIGRIFLNAWNARNNQSYSPGEFFDKEFFRFFYDHPKYMQWRTDSPFVQGAIRGKNGEYGIPEMAKDEKGNVIKKFEKSKNKKSHENAEFGFLAQELMTVYPELVSKDTLGYYYVNYIGLIPVLVEALKEQKIEIDALKSAYSASNSGPKKVGASTGLNETDVLTYPVLDQNIPNPFNTSTRIGYYLPTTIASASLYVYDMNGVQLKSYLIAERGKGNITIQGSELNAGMYLYALIADGKVIDTKRMILTK